MGEHWTKDEDKALMIWYPRMGLRMKGLLPKRSEEQIYNRARVLGLRTPDNEWSKHEIQILKDKYPKIGMEVRKYLAYRSDVAIRGMVSRLGIKTENSKCNTNWTGTEDDILRQNYPSMGSVVSNQLSGRSENAIKARASMLGAVKTKRNRWSDKEIAILKKYYPKLGSEVIATRLGRSKEAITAMAYRLGIKYIGR